MKHKNTESISTLAIVSQKFIKFFLILISAFLFIFSAYQPARAQNEATCGTNCYNDNCPNGFTSLGRLDCDTTQVCCIPPLQQTPARTSPLLDAIEKSGLPSFRFSQSNAGTLGGIIAFAIPWIIAVAGMLLLLYLLYGGFHLMISGGDPKVVAEARGKITNALIGFVIIFVAYWLVQLVAQIFGLQQIQGIFG